MAHTAISDSAKEAVIIANSPSFLLSKLKADSSVRMIVDTFSSAEISKRVAELLSTKPSNPLELTERYVWLIAYGIKSSFAEWRSSKLDASTVPWGAELVALITEEKRETFGSTGSASRTIHSDTNRAPTRSVGWTQQRPNILTSAGRK